MLLHYQVNLIFHFGDFIFRSLIHRQFRQRVSDIKLKSQVWRYFLLASSCLIMQIFFIHLNLMFIVGKWDEKKAYQWCDKSQHSANLSQYIHNCVSYSEVVGFFRRKKKIPIQEHIRVIFVEWIQFRRFQYRLTRLINFDEI